MSDRVRDENTDTPDDLNAALEELARVVAWVEAERKRELGFEMFVCPACSGRGFSREHDTCVCCHGARWVDEDRTAWWEDWRNVG